MKDLGQDLRSIRQALNLEIEDVHRITRIPIPRLKAIEEGTVVPDGMSADTYVRASIRSYAKVLGIEDRITVEALNLCAQGVYRDELIASVPSLRLDRRFQEDEPRMEVSPQPDPVPAREAAGQVSPQPAPRTAPVPDVIHRYKDAVGNDAGGRMDPGSVGWSLPRYASPRKSKRLRIGRFARMAVLSLALLAAGYQGYMIVWGGSDAAEDAAGEGVAELSDSNNGNGLAMNDAAASSSNAGESADGSLGVMGGSSQAIGAGSGAVAGGAASMAGARPGDSGSAVRQAETASASGAETAVRTRPATSRTASPVYDVVIYAASEALDPVMVWTDLKPATDFYTIPKGEALRFKAGGAIRIQGQYADMMVFINGRLVTNIRELHYDRAQRMIDIGRNTLRDYGAAASGSTLSMPGGVEPPREIRAVQP